jgi:hypothetical protein
VPERVETHDSDGVDYGWVMQTTFVVTIVVGAPTVALLSASTPLETWSARAEFALRVGAIVWFLTAIAVFAYAATRRDGGSPDERVAGDAMDEPSADGESEAGET